MCTVTIQRDKDIVRVTMNRDERHERIETGLYSDGTQHALLFPEDGSSGGTWIGVNADGVMACLMNRYDQPPEPSRISRGSIVVDALARGEIAHIEYWLRNGFRPVRFNPFTLFVVTCQRTLCLEWTSATCQWLDLPVQPWIMVTSSSENAVAVTHYRQRQFEHWLKQGAPFRNGIAGFHFQHDAAALDRSILMSRPHSHTKSLTQITLSETKAQMVYLPQTVLGAWAAGDTSDEAAACDGELETMSMDECL